MRLFLVLWCAALFPLSSIAQDADEILQKVDDNMYSTTRVFEATMIVNGRRGSREITLKGWSEGDTRSLTEYLSPAREQGTKMLKLADHLWIYTPSSDRTIQISGHMLRQSLMGSDVSYEDMMEDGELRESYSAKLIGEEVLEGRNCWVLQLDAKVEDVSYQSRKVWIDVERYIPLQEELFAKSGQLLKKTVLSNVEKMDGRWFPKTMLYKDMLKEGKGTEFTINTIQFDKPIDEFLFSKAALKK